MEKAVSSKSCEICTQRLGWPSDRAFSGQDIHFAVQLKCCRQFVGESCARKLKAELVPTCPFCRAVPIALDGSLNDILFD
jgi:hypothetical protein